MSDIPSPPHSPYAPVPAPPRNPWESTFGRIRRTGRNLNQGQFSNSPVARGLGRVLDAQQRARTFRTAGMGAALRYTLGVPQMTPDVESAYRAKLYQQGGLNPGMLAHHEADITDVGD